MVFVHFRVGDYLRLGANNRAGIMKNFFAVLSFCALLVTSGYANAQTRLVFDTNGNITGSYVEGTPSHNLKMQAAISGNLQRAAANRGFSNNDPRTNATVSRSSQFLGTAAGAAAAVTVGALTAPTWASVALVAAVSSVIGYSVTLAIDGLVKWLFKNNNIDVSTSTVSAPFIGMSQGGEYWSTGGPNGVIYGGDGIAVARQGYQELAQFNEDMGSPIASPACRYVGGNTPETQSIALCTATKPDAAGGYMERQALKYTEGAPATCGTGYYYLDSRGCMPYSIKTGNEPMKDASVQSATNALPEAEKQKPLNPEIVAALTNTAWKKAASQPGYDGLPYNQNNPITSQEVQQWAKENPEYWPTVGDFVQPNPDLGSAASSPSTLLPLNPSTQTNPSTNEPGATQPQKLDLGPDPNIGSPGLEAIPTAEQIAYPILNLLPQLTSFEVDTPDGICPRPSFDLYGHHVLEAHCDLIDDNKPAIQSAMILAWALIALLIILSA